MARWLRVESVANSCIGRLAGADLTSRDGESRFYEVSPGSELQLTQATKSAYYAVYTHHGRSMRGWVEAKTVQTQKPTPSAASKADESQPDDS